MLKWCGADKVDPNSRGGQMDARQLVALENLFGEAYRGNHGANPAHAQAPILKEIFNKLSDELYCELLIKSTALQFIIQPIVDTSGKTTGYNLDYAKQMLDGIIAIDKDAGLELLGNYWRVVKAYGYADATNADYQKYLDFYNNYSAKGTEYQKTLLLFSSRESIAGGADGDVLTGTSGNDKIYGLAGDDRIAGGMGSDYIEGGAGNDIIEGNGFADTLYGGDGDDTLFGEEEVYANSMVAGDTLIGGKGNDALSGGTGNDVYRFAVGDGRDIIADTDGNDTAAFGATDLRLMMDRLNDDLVLSTAGTADQVTVKDWYENDNNKVETIQSGNGRQLLSTQIDSMMAAMVQLQAEKGMSWNELINSAPSETQTVLNQFWTENK